MSRTPEGNSGVLSAGSNTIKTVGADSSIVITSLILTNLEAVIGECQIFIERDADRLVTIVSIPSGNGKSVNVSVLNGTSLNDDDVLSITSDKGNINFDFSDYVIT